MPETPTDPPTAADLHLWCARCGRALRPSDPRRAALRRRPGRMPEAPRCCAKRMCYLPRPSMSR